ncbi:MAG TPA: flagellar hook-basal body complex protein FliE [Limnobacter sp.]|nr:flagellar hook-basal body complex protein FliE [Limnobacter sp.]
MIENTGMPAMGNLTLNPSQSARQQASVQADMPSFTEVFAQVLDSVSQAQANSRSLAVGLQMNDPKVSVEDVAIASNEASLKFQTVLQTRNKLLQAYSEIMSMPV